MKFKLDLSNPIWATFWVSTGDEKDQLDIIFKFPFLFKSALDERVLEENYTLYSEVPARLDGIRGRVLAKESIY